MGFEGCSIRNCLEAMKEADGIVAHIQKSELYHESHCQ